jgi:hypothetical protein
MYVYIYVYIYIHTCVYIYLFHQYYRLEVKASGELWWVFQHVDMAVEAVIEGIDGALGEFLCSLLMPY